MLPRVASIPQYSSSAGSEIFDLMDRLKRPLDPWQKFVIGNGLGQNWTGDRDPASGLPQFEWASDNCGCWVPRQNGKGDIIMALELGWLFLFGEPLVVHSAHEYKTAQEGYLRIKSIVQDSTDLDPLVNRYWQANGEQGIELVKNKRKRMIGARLRFMARTRAAGRGFSGGKIVLDEGQELTEAQMNAIMHVASAQINWQIWYFGTPPDDNNAWIYNLKESGEAGDERVMWIDYGMETIDTDDRRELNKLRDPALHRATNPAMSVGRIKQRTIDGQLKLMGAGQSFAMERCGMWLPRARKDADYAIDPEAWAEAFDEAALNNQTRPEQVTLSFHVNAKRTHATIMYAGIRPGGMWQVGVVAHKRGTDWLIGKLWDAIERWRPVAVTVDTKSETTITDLKEIGVELPESAEEPKRGDLILPTSADVATAYGMLVDAANNRHLVHLDEAPLNTAITAPPRPLAGGSTWDHKRGLEVGPAVGAGLAMWAHRERLDKIKTTYDPLLNIY